MFYSTIHTYTLNNADKYLAYIGRYVNGVQFVPWITTCVNLNVQIFGIPKKLCIVFMKMKRSTEERLLCLLIWFHTCVVVFFHS